MLKQAMPLPLHSANYTFVLHIQRLHTPICQRTMPELGNSRGACYGFTLSMVDAELNPYRTDKPMIFNRTIHQYQKRQLERKTDQLHIKRERLTPILFEPSPKQRAKALLEIANKHLDSELCVDLYDHDSGHSTYLNLQSNEEVRYMDPNLGAYLFKNRKEFIAAYEIFWLHRREKNNRFYLTYSVNKLHDDKNLERVEKKTWQGIFRSLLTGNKYQQAESVFDFLPHMAAALLSFTPFIWIGALIGGLIFPGIGLLIGAIIGAAIPIAIKISSIMDGYSGLLGPVLWIRSHIYLLTDSIKKTFGIKREWDQLPNLGHTTLDTPSVVKPITASSSTPTPRPSEIINFSSPLAKAPSSPTKAAITVTCRIK